MKNKLSILLTLLLTTQLSAAWYCESVSPSGWGFWTSPSHSLSYSKATTGCRMNTPQWQVCRTECWYTQR